MSVGGAKDTTDTPRDPASRTDSAREHADAGQGCLIAAEMTVADSTVDRSAVRVEATDDGRNTRNGRYPVRVHAAPGTDLFRACG